AVDHQQSVRADHLSAAPLRAISCLKIPSPHHVCPSTERRSEQAQEHKDANQAASLSGSIGRGKLAAKFQKCSKLISGATSSPRRASRQTGEHKPNDKSFVLGVGTKYSAVRDFVSNVTSCRLPVRSATSLSYLQQIIYVDYSRLNQPPLGRLL